MILLSCYCHHRTVCRWETNGPRPIIIVLCVHKTNSGLRIILLAF